MLAACLVVSLVYQSGVLSVCVSDCPITALLRLTHQMAALDATLSTSVFSLACYIALSLILCETCNIACLAYTMSILQCFDAVGWVAGRASGL